MKSLFPKFIYFIPDVPDVSQKRKREREREIDREIERQRDRETDRQREREREREIERERESVRENERQIHTNKMSQEKLSLCEETQHIHFFDSFFLSFSFSFFLSFPFLPYSFFFLCLAQFLRSFTCVVRAYIRLRG